jgi:hypothetical protein
MESGVGLFLPTFLGLGMFGVGIALEDVVQLSFLALPAFFGGIWTVMEGSLLPCPESISGVELLLVLHVINH